MRVGMARDYITIGYRVIELLSYWKVRIIQPYIFVKTGLRWHLGVFVEKHQKFRGFVLSRFRGQPEILNNATHNAALDIVWNSSIEIV
jgi:predicted DNA-binding transcriptional regulator YafY